MSVLTSGSIAKKDKRRWLPKVEYCTLEEKPSGVVATER